jgi:hypothetical protein
MELRIPQKSPASGLTQGAIASLTSSKGRVPGLPLGSLPQDDFFFELRKPDVISTGFLPIYLYIHIFLSSRLARNAEPGPNALAPDPRALPVDQRETRPGNEVPGADPKRGLSWRPAL